MSFLIRLFTTLTSGVVLAGVVATTATATPSAVVAGQEAPVVAPAPTPASPVTPPNINLRPGGTEIPHAKARAAQVDAAQDLVNHGGPIMPSSTTFTIFWLPPGHDSVSTNYISLMNRYLADIGGSPMYNILTQYSGSNGATTNSSTFGGTWTDTASFPAGHDGSNHAGRSPTRTSGTR